eukprot:5089222-Alexandrium_andersonii.AAC.1
MSRVRSARGGLVRLPERSSELQRPGSAGPEVPNPKGLRRWAPANSRPRRPKQGRATPKLLRPAAPVGQQ